MAEPKAELPTAPRLLDRICQRDGISAEAAEGRLFWCSIAPWRRPVVWLLRGILPDLFAHDLNVVRDAGRMTQLAGLNDTSDLLHRRLPTQGQFIRVTLGFRISANRLIEVAKEYFRAEPPRQ